MAAPDDIQDKENKDGNPVIEDKEAKPVKGKKKKLLIITVGLIILLAGGSYFAIPYFKGDTEITEGAEGENAAREETSVEKKVKATFALDPFLVNLADKNEMCFVKTTFKLGLSSEPQNEVTDIDIASMRDSIITLLTSKTSEQILTTEGKQHLRDQVRERMNELPLEMDIVEVYIVDFVVQL
jgi:flagellar FliL protein